MADEKPKQAVDRSRLRLLAALSAGAAGGGCTSFGPAPNWEKRWDERSTPPAPSKPQEFGGSGGGGGGGGGGGH